MEEIIVDGYNLIHAGEETRALARWDLESARERVIGDLAEFAALEDIKVEVVFDAGGSEGMENRFRPTPLLTVTYTGKGESA